MEREHIDYLNHLSKEDAEEIRSINRYLTQAALKVLIENGIFPTVEFVEKYSEVGEE